MSTKSVFISYAHQDQPRVKTLTQSMEMAGIGFWIDERGLIAGQKFNEEIALAIEECDIFLLVLTNNSVVSQYISEELNYARSLKKRLYFLQLEEVEESKMSRGIKVLIASYHIDIVYDLPLSETAKKLISTLNQHLNSDGGIHEPSETLNEKDSIEEGINHYLKLAWDKAFHIFDKHRKTSPEALFYLGEMYFLGRFVKRNLGTAQHIYKEAISRGEGRAGAGLAFIYDELDEFPDQKNRLFEEGFKALWEASLNGDAYSANYLAVLYDKGKGIKQSTEKAVKYFKQAASQGYVIAQSNLGNMYEEALGVVRDYDEARKWYTFAAENGSVLAQFRLGKLYEEGLGVKPDLEKAVYWYQEAAQANLADSWPALRQLGIFYHEGKGGLNRDYKQALSLFQQAADQGDTIALTWIGLMYEMADGVEQDYEKALECYKAANFKDPNYDFVQLCLGDVYLNGRGVPPDTATAVEWYKKANKNGSAQAGYLLGTIYEQGLDVNKNGRVAFDYYIQAAEDGIADAIYKVGSFYEAGKYVTKDIDKALYWYTLGATNGDAECMYHCGLLHLLEGELDSSYRDALIWLYKATEHNHIPAHYWYGYMVEFGLGVKAEYAVARGWYEVAAEANYSSALNRLGRIYLYGLAVEKDEKKASTLFTKSYEQKNFLAAYHLGYMHENGLGMHQNYSKALTYYSEAATNDYSPAQMRLAWMYMNGIGVKQDLHEAAAYYNDAANSNSPDSQAMCYLGWMYECGHGIAKNSTQARDLYFKAFKEENQLAIAILYEKGWGVNQNVDTAVRYYQAECDKNDSLAQYRLAQLLISLTANNNQSTASIFESIVYWLQKSAQSGFWLSVEALEILVKNDTDNDG